MSFNVDTYIIRPNEIPNNVGITGMLDEVNPSFLDIETYRRHIIDEQIKTFNYWLIFFEKYNIDDEIIDWILESVVKMGVFNRDSLKFGRRNRHTICPFAEVNKDLVLRIISSHPDFNITTFRSAYQESLSELLSSANSKGIWCTYEGISQINAMFDSLQGYFTGWCHASYNSALLHLMAGPISIYYTKTEFGFTYPRLTIWYSNAKIGRIECVGLDKNEMVEGSLLNTSLDYLQKQPYYEQSMGEELIRTRKIKRY